MTPSGARIASFFGMVAFSAGCASVSASTSPPAPATQPDTHRLVVRAYIDGSDFLVLRGNQVRWLHRSWERPGRDDGSEPTYLDHTAWWPEWQNGLVSLPTAIPDPLPSSPEAEVQLVVRRARGSVRVAEKPSAQNGYALTVLFDDDGINGASWYEIALEWK